jgi:hypothetical protein
MSAPASATDITVEVNVLSEQPHTNHADHLGITDSTTIAVKSAQTHTLIECKGCARMCCVCAWLTFPGVVGVGVRRHAYWCALSSAIDPPFRSCLPPCIAAIRMSSTRRLTSRLSICTRRITSMSMVRSCSSRRRSMNIPSRRIARSARRTPRPPLPQLLLFRLLELRTTSTGRLNESLTSLAISAVCDVSFCASRAQGAARRCHASWMGR